MKKYDLEERTLNYANQVRNVCLSLQSSKVASSDINQVIKSSGSIGANYIEANEGISKKDLIHRLRIARKEAKETHYWLKLIIHQSPDEYKEILTNLIKEADELRAILSSIITKVS